MDDAWEEIADAIESRNPHRVDDAIDRIEDADADERARLFAIGFGELAAVYADSDDGSVRQAAARVAERLTPGLRAASLLADEDRADGDVVAGLPDRVDALCGLLLEALQDEDGQVRQSAKRGLQKVYRSYRALDDEATLAALIGELDALAGDYSGPRRDHLLESKADAELLLSDHGARLVEGVRKAGEGTEHE